MSDWWDNFWTGLSGLAGLACAGWVLWRWYQNSDDRLALLARWVISLLDLLFIVFMVGPQFAEGKITAPIGLIMTAMAASVLAVVWAPPIVEAAGRRVSALFDGGRTPAEREPLLSVVEARRKQGRPAEAAQFLREQLKEFPRHFPGQMLLAEILADDLHDLAGAEAVVEEILRQEHHAPRNLAYALTRLADWRLKHAHDAAGARICFERIIERMPDTPEAHQARQRCSRLSGTETLFQAAQAGPRRLEVPRADPHLGVRQGPTPPPPTTAPTPDQQLAALIRQLEASPHDNRAREELATLYAGEYDRPDLAIEQLERLIAQPHASEHDLARWYNRLADLCLQFPGGEREARRVLEALIARNPASAPAEVARRRLPLLAREAKKKGAKPAVRLASPSASAAPSAPTKASAG